MNASVLSVKQDSIARMKMSSLVDAGLRVSSYVVCSKPFGSQLSVMCHGYTGAVDIVPERIARIFQPHTAGATWDARVLRKTPPGGGSTDVTSTGPDQTLALAEITHLRARGYLTELTEDDERRYVAMLVERIHAYYTQHLAVLIAPFMDCNLRCAYCFQRDLQKSIARDPNAPIASLMTIDQVDTIFDVLSQQRDAGIQIRREITLYGGEALQLATREIVEYIVGKSKARGFKLKAISNGFELDRFAGLLGSHGIEHVQITIDGLEESHNRKRPGRHGDLTYSRILTNLASLLRETDIRFEIGINVDKQNIGTLPSFLESLREQGLVGHPRVSIHANEIYSVKSRKSAFEDDFGSLQAIRDKAAEYGVMLSNATGNLQRLLLKRIADRKALPLKPVYCSAVTGMFIFAPDGDLYSCWEAIGESTGRVGVYYPEFAIDKNSFDRWIQRVSSRIDECHRCEYIMFCGGGCTMNAQRRTGRFLSPYCDNFESKYADLLTHVGRNWMDGGPTPDTAVALNASFSVYRSDDISETIIETLIGASSVPTREGENWLCNFH